MKTNNFYGIDKDIETSLFEYGVLTSKDNKVSFVGVAQKAGSFYEFIQTDWGDGDILDVIMGSWFNKKAFFTYLSTTKTQWLTTPLPNKIYDMVNYYGWDNFFSPYNIISKKETIELIENYGNDNRHETAYTAYSEGDSGS